jgi:septal ring factor EnvC (AmiA/AmiB activator)
MGEDINKDEIIEKLINRIHKLRDEIDDYEESLNRSYQEKMTIQDENRALKEKLKELLVIKTCLHSSHLSLAKIADEVKRLSEDPRLVCVGFEEKKEESRRIG